MSDNKLVKSILDATTITGLVAGIGWIGRKIIKEDPSANAMNYVKFTPAMTGALALETAMVMGMSTLEFIKMRRQNANLKP